MAFDGFTMPPAIAGDKNKVTADSDGASNLLSVTGGLTILGLAAAAAFRLQDGLMDSAGMDEDSRLEVSVN